jgi:hypothetical protein
VDKKKSVVDDPQAETQEFQDSLHESTLKTIKQSNPELHAVLEKYKGAHADQTPTEEN